MSKFKVQVNHVPANYKTYSIPGLELKNKYEELGVQMPFPRADSWYYYTDPEGWATLVSHLLFKSSLYKEDIFDCDDYAMKAQVTCAELYGLNTCRCTYGHMPLGFHGFNSMFCGDRFLLLEPNEGYQYEDPLFEWGIYGYNPEFVLL